MTSACVMDASRLTPHTCALKPGCLASGDADGAVQLQLLLVFESDDGPPMPRSANSRRYAVSEPSTVGLSRRVAEPQGIDNPLNKACRARRRSDG